MLHSPNSAMGRQVGLRLADLGWLGWAALLPSEALLGLAPPAWGSVCSMFVQSGAGLLMVLQRHEGSPAAQAHLKPLPASVSQSKSHGQGLSQGWGNRPFL